MLAQTRARLVAWLLPLTAGQVAATVGVWWWFVRTREGQRLDTIALSGNTIGRSQVEGLVDRVLEATTVVSVAAATIVIGFIALVRRRVLLAAMATLLIAGANVTTQILKYALYRPDFGIDLARLSAGNSLPSGHATMAASVAVALVLVLPARVRAAAAMLGAGYAALAGVATVSADWHRPSDVVVSLLIVGGWATATGLVLALATPATAVPGERHRAPVALLALGGFALLAVAAVGLALTGQVASTPPDLLSRGRLFTAYAGSAAGIAGTASLVMACVLVTMHWVVPERSRAPEAALVGAAR